MKKITILTTALALLAFLTFPLGLWGQSDYSTDYVGNITLSATGGTSASVCKVIINNVEYDGIKAGTGSVAGAMKIAVPANTKYLHMHVAAWNNNTVSLAVTPDGYSDPIALTANSGISNNSPFTFNGDPSTSDYYKVITFANALGADTELTFTATGGKRFVIWGVTSEEDGVGPTVATPTFSPVGGTYTEAQTVSISCETQGTTIYYTLDGSTPDDESTQYTTPITVSETKTIKAIAYDSNDNTSNVASATYTIVTPMTIAEVRAQETGDVVTTGTVTSCAGTTGYIQDATAAICVYGTSLTVGDNISVLGTLSNYNGLLEITNPQVTVISSGNTINPELMTIAEVVASTNQGWYIRIEDAIVTAISDKNVTIAQGDDNVVVRFANASDITFEVNDIISLNGNIGAYNGVQIANPQNVTVQENTNPSISAENVNIASDATSGNIEFTINNPVTGGVTSATTNDQWLTLGTVGSATVPFTCTANTATTARTATVVLTYTYSRATVTKEVTVTQAAYEAPHVTWDLSIASYASASEQQVTWTSDYATMVVDKANASTNANNYLGGNQTSTRFYKNSELTLSPAAGYAITSVVFTATTSGYAAALQSSTWTNATASVDGTTVTVTPTDGANDMVAVIGGTCGFTSVTVYYEVNNAPSITANNVEITYDTDADEIEYVINNPVSGGSLVASTESDWLEVDSDPMSGNAGTIEFTCSVNTAANTRTAIVTLTYTYNRAIVIKEVTVTQAGNPNATMTIAEVRAQGTGDVVTTGTVTSFSVNSSNNKTTAYIQDATAAIVVFGEFTVAVGDEIRVLGTLDTYHGLLEITNPEVTVISQGNTVTPEVMTIAQVVASTNQGWYIRIEDATVTEINGQNTTIAQGENTIVVHGISGVEYAVNDVISLNGNIGCYNDIQIANPTNVEVQAVPSITITPDSFELDANSHVAEVLAPIAYHNIVVESGSGTESFDVQYYDAEGHEIEQTWCSVGAAAQGDTGFNLIIAAGINEGNEARTAYFKLYGLDAEDNLVYSNLVTVTQAAPVIDYAVLPFVWEGGPKADFLALNGVTAQGLGDYATGNAPYLIKFDNTGDYIQVKCDQQPGKVTIGVKMIGGANTSTITIQGSADGETFTDIEVLTISGAQNDELTLETTNVFADADRYVRLLFNKGSNVGVGPITIAKGSAPSISVTPATLNLEATGTGQNGMQMQQFGVTYHNLDIESYSDFTVQFYDADGEVQEQPTWIIPNPANVAGGNEEGYLVMLFIEGNTGVARSAYFKVFALDADENVVYSNLVTINQAGVAQQYTLTVEPFENLDLITFVNDEMVLEGDGEITVTEGNQIMLSVVAMEGYVMETLMVNGVDHVNDIAGDFTYSFEMPAENVTISATAVEDVPFEPVAYTLATSIESGKTYIFVGKKTIDEMDNYYAMGEQKSNNRGGVAINVDGETAIVESDVVYEFVITALDASGFYSIYESRTPGYLYAASSEKNYLRTESELDANHNGEWEISIDDETGLFSIVASNSNNRNVMQFNYNNGSTLFSCYGSASQSPVYLYEKTEVVPETHTLDLTGYGTNEGRYYLIASPVSMIRPTADNGFLTEAYDLYYFDQAQEGEEWRNYKAKQFNIASGKGYLYASQANTSLTFTGMPYTGNGEITLDQVGWNLIGNPYSTIAAVDHDFYILNTNGSELELSEVLGVNPMQGIFVLAESENEVVVFDSGTAQGGGDEKNINIRVSNENGISDFARIRFGEGKDLGKLMLNENHTKLYFPVDGNEYAVVYVNDESEMPICFKAETDGIYTFSVKAENMEMQYLHLIDNLTGMDVDLLANPSYSFEASVNDNAARFTLVIRNK